jgi:hypothetical protein
MADSTTCATLSDNLLVQQQIMGQYSDWLQAGLQRGQEFSFLDIMMLTANLQQCQNKKQKKVDL